MDADFDMNVELGYDGQQQALPLRYDDGSRKQL
jgi:hypothetical protein